MSVISIYNFKDYRLFLKERFAELKKGDPRFSYRFFNRLAGIQSSGFIKLVMDGKRNLAQDGIRKIAKGLKFNEQERKYFEALVNFNQSRTNEEKDFYYRELCLHQPNHKIKKLTDAEYHLFSHWFYVVILEALRFDTHKKKDIHWLQNRIKPTIKLQAIDKAVKELKLLNLVSESDNGTLHVREVAMMTTPDEVKSVQVANFHTQMSEMAIHSIRHDAPSYREFSGLTVATSKKGFNHIKKTLQEFRRRLHTITEKQEGQAKTIVAHINLQLFQLSREEE